MNSWLPAIIAIVVNVAVIIFSYGKLCQSVIDLKERLIKTEESREKNCDRLEDKIEERAHTLLPECVQEFKGINNQLGELSGKVDMLIMMIRKGG